MSKEIKKAIPKLRFPDFQGFDEWNYQFGDKIFEPIADKDHNSDLPVLAITQEHGAIPREQIDYHVSVTDKSLETYKVVQIGDFIISLRSFQGGIEYSNYKGICSPAYIILRKIENIDDDFFRHYFKTPIFISDLNKNIEGIRDGKMVSFKQFSELSLPYPKVAEQQKIASCLSSLDELIAANTQKLEALKAHKKGLMQQLFPAEGETVPRLRFPEFEGDGEWEESKLIDVSKEKLSNGVFNDPEKTGRGYRLINVLDMYIETYIDETKLSLLEIEEVEFSKNKVENGDVFFTRSSLVKSGIAHSNIYLGFSNDITFDGHLIRLRPNRGQVDPLFLHYLLKTNLVRSQLISKGKTATMTTIGQNDIAETKVIRPRIKEQQKIATCLSSLDALITAQSEKIEALKTHKKGLMQGLFPSEL